VDFSASYLLVVYVSDWSGKSVDHGDAVMIVASFGVIAAVYDQLWRLTCVCDAHACLSTYLLYKSGYGVWITWLFIDFPCSTILFLFQFFFHFQFSESFSSSVMLVPYSYLLLSTPLLVCFLVNQPHYHRFSVFRFHKLLVRMHYTKLAVPVSFLVQSLYYVVSYRMISSAQ